MKLIKYRIMTEVNRGTEDRPDVVQTFSPAELQSTDADLESNLSLARSEACNGEVTVEEAPDDPSRIPPPSREELAAENKLLREQVAALSGQNDFHEELIVELAGIVYA